MSFLKKAITSNDWSEVLQRIERLEEKAFGKKKPPITLKQQILALKHLGMLDKIQQLDIPVLKKYEFLALLLKTDVSNTGKALTQLADNDGDIINKFNYEYLAQLFQDFGITSQANDTHKILFDLKQFE